MLRNIPSAWALILAAGSGSRMGGAGGVPKQFILWKNLPLYWHSALAMAASGVVGGLVFLFPPAVLEREKTHCEKLAGTGANFGLPFKIAAGGARRQDSVLNGLEALPPGVREVLVHDAARPFASPALIRRVFNALKEGYDGVIPGLPLSDTIKIIQPGASSARTLPRDRLLAVQTPQAFNLDMLKKGHLNACEKGLTVTDDAALLEVLGCKTAFVEGEADNIKLTRPADLRLLAFQERDDMDPVTGFGYDVHRFGAGRPLRLGGIPVPGGFEVIAHSDGDVLLHALMDAMLGCASLGDIGMHFPDNDPRFEGASSAMLLDHVSRLCREAGLELRHVDLTLVAQKPRIAPFRDEIRNNVARLLDLPRNRVNFKATTEEGLGFTGALEGLKACAVVSGLRGRKTSAPQT